ncbi:unnamed protein product, partial [Cladocopium goreaui]
DPMERSQSVPAVWNGAGNPWYSDRAQTECLLAANRVKAKVICWAAVEKVNRLAEVVILVYKLGLAQLAQSIEKNVLDLKTQEWHDFAAKYGISLIHMDQHPMGHKKRKPTTVATNMEELFQLDGLRGEPDDEVQTSEAFRAMTLPQRIQESKTWSAWAPGLKEAIVEALNRHVQRLEGLADPLDPLQEQPQPQQHADGPAQEAMRRKRLPYNLMPKSLEEDRCRQLNVEKDSGEEVLVKFQRSEGASSTQSSTSVSITTQSGLQQHGESTSLSSRSGLQQHGESTSLSSRSGLQQHGESTSLSSRSGLQQHGESTSLSSRSGLQQHGESTSISSRSGLQQRAGQSPMMAGESTSSGSATTSGLAVGEPSSSGSSFAAGSAGVSVEQTPKQGTPRNPWNAFQREHKGKGLSTKTKASMYNFQKNK